MRGNKERSTNASATTSTSSPLPSADSEASSSEAAARALRDTVRQTHPEIDRLYTDAYLQAVLSVPDRSYEYARDEKITKALEWRRTYGVDALTVAFCCDEDSGGIFHPISTATKTKEEQSGAQFTPSQQLINVCKSGAFVFHGFDRDGRAILLARTARLDWWKTGVDDGIRYHVLVMEYALQQMAERRRREESIASNASSTDNGDCNNGENAETNSSSSSAAAAAAAAPESMALYVDTAKSSLIPPPMGALTGMISLLQRVYPDRIHRIHVGPVNSLLRSLYDAVSPMLRPRSRDKIVLLESSPKIKCERTSSE